MNLQEEEDFALRRRLLATEIARQRGELARAFDSLATPIRYTEYGMRGFGFIRQNPWIFAAVPAVYSLATNFFGGKKKTSSRPPTETPPTTVGRLKGVKNIVTTGIGHGWKLYQLYRRVRTYLP